MSDNQIGTNNKISFTERRKVVFASFVGTAVEWYDFILYGLMAALVFPELFFPSLSPIYGTLASFITFAVGFIARPLGGVLFGHIADKYGRKPALMISLLGMGIATVLIGFLPTAAMIGIWAPILLGLMRLIQGLSAGGEWGSAVTLVLENAPPKKRGLFGSIPQMGVPAGLLLSNAAVFLTQMGMSDEAFMAWGWRVPFFVSIVMIVIGIYIRKNINESPIFLEKVEKIKQHKKSPVLSVLKKEKKLLFLTAGMKLLQNSVFYIYTVFILSYLTNELHMQKSDGIIALMIASALGFLSLPAWGYLSDKIGRKPVYLSGTILSALFMFPFFWMLHSQSLLITIIAVVIGLNIFHDAVYGPQAAYYTELFNTEERASGASIGYSLGTVLAGGFTPMIATALLALSGGYTLIVIFLLVVGAVSTIATLYARETYKDSIN
ncbi:MFS transporter [Bacillus sp. JJ1566]|uniref:MFS transporter n=1 Tax=Bacillus sp. JJ1566 TaxID=3122961 RepID=UPI002FFF4793